MWRVFYGKRTSVTNYQIGYKILQYVIWSFWMISATRILRRKKSKKKVGLRVLEITECQTYLQLIKSSNTHECFVRFCLICNEKPSGHFCNITPIKPAYLSTKYIFCRHSRFWPVNFAKGTLRGSSLPVGAAVVRVNLSHFKQIWVRAITILMLHK
jgi:hypothetical protein